MPLAYRTALVRRVGAAAGVERVPAGGRDAREQHPKHAAFVLAYARGAQASAALQPKLRAPSSALLRRYRFLPGGDKLRTLHGALLPPGLAEGLRGAGRSPSVRA